MSRDQVILWHQSAIDDSSMDVYFKKYIFEYIAFVDALHLMYPNIVFGRDGGLVNRLKRRQDLQELYIRKINTRPNREVKECWDSVYRELNNKKLKNLTQSDKKFDYWNCSHPRDMGRLRFTEDWENMINYWRAIRNNLLHGGKSPDQRRDVRFVKYGYLTLNPMLEVLLSQI